MQKNLLNFTSQIYIRKNLYSILSKFSLESEEKNKNSYFSKETRDFQHPLQSKNQKIPLFPSEIIPLFHDKLKIEKIKNQTKQNVVDFQNTSERKEKKQETNRAKEIHEIFECGGIRTELRILLLVHKCILCPRICCSRVSHPEEEPLT